MNRFILTTSLAGFFALGATLVIDAAAANSRNGQSANTSRHGAPFHHHRKHRINPYVPYYYGGYGYGYTYVYDVDYGPPPPAQAAKPAAPKPAVETRRGCEPQTYSVPGSDGGESQVTVLRC